MDEFLVDGETTSGTSRAGSRARRSFGGAMRVGYLPDMFGHVAQMPQILRPPESRTRSCGAACPAAVDRHSFRWEAPDGSAVRAEYLPYGYGNAAHCFDEPGGRRSSVRGALRPLVGDDHVLAMVGTDHMPLPLPTAARVAERDRLDLA